MSLNWTGARLLQFPPELLEFTLARLSVGSLGLVTQCNITLSAIAQKPSFVKRLAHNAGAPDCNSWTLGQLDLWLGNQAIRKLQQADTDPSGKAQPAHIRFHFASIEVYEIGSPQATIAAVAALLQRHSTAVCILNGHVGPNCPEDIAVSFTAQRCLAVAEALTGLTVVASRILMLNWGSKVSASAWWSHISEHDAPESSRVEIFFRLGALELPERPSCYTGFHMTEEQIPISTEEVDEADESLFDWIV